MNREQMQALRRVVEHYGHDDVKHYEEAGKPAGHIAEDLLALDHYMQACSLDIDNEAKDTIYPAAGSNEPAKRKPVSVDDGIIWSLLNLANLPLSIENLVRDAVVNKNPELRAPALAALETLQEKRHPEDVIPF